MASNRRPEVASGLEAGFPSAVEEKEALNESSSIAVSPSGQRAQAPTEKMPSPRHLLVTLLVCFLVAFGLATAVSPRSLQREPCHEKSPEIQQPPVPQADESTFSYLLNAVSPESLHDLLHRYFPKTYKHGVYPSDHSAMEAVHRANAALATSMIQMAKRDGASNTTSSSPPPTSGSTSTSPPPNGETSSSPPPSSTPPTSTSSPPPVSSGSSTSNTLPTSTSEVTSTSTSETTTLPTSSSGTLSSTTASSSASSSAPPSVSSSSSPSSTAPTSTGSGPSSTSSAGSTLSKSTTSSASRSSKPVTSTFTSTINGTPTVVIATSYVGVDASVAPTSTKGPGGSLQTNAAAAPNRQAVLEAMVGVVIGGAMLIY